MATAKAAPATVAPHLCCLPDRFAYKEAIRGRAVRRSATASLFLRRVRRHAHLVSSSILPALPFRAVDPRGTRVDGAARRGTGVGAARRVPDAQSSGNDAGAGGGRCPADPRRGGDRG